MWQILKFINSEYEGLLCFYNMLCVFVCLKYLIILKKKWYYTTIKIIKSFNFLHCLTKAKHMRGKRSLGYFMIISYS